MLDRLEGVENRTITKITSRKRTNRSLWNRVALREAVINAIIHNDYTTELVPKFEIFADRLEMTSAGHIHQGEEREDFFAGYSIPRNKTLMRVFKDLDMVEYLGSGMPRILKAYSKDAYIFSSRFIRTVFPIDQVALTMEREGSKITSESRLGDKLGDNERTVLLLLAKNRKASIASVAAVTDLSTTGVEKIISRLKDKGVLKRIGPARGGYWEVLEES